MQQVQKILSIGAVPSRDHEPRGCFLTVANEIDESNCHIATWACQAKTIRYEIRGLLRSPAAQPYRSALRRFSSSVLLLLVKDLCFSSDPKSLAGSSSRLDH